MTKTNNYLNCYCEKTDMENTNMTQVTKDQKENSILVSRVFNAPLEKVWQAHTDSQVLDRWWGPSP